MSCSSSSSAGSKSGPRDITREQSDRIDKLVERGHSPHCACGIVFRGEKCYCKPAAVCEIKK